VRDKSVGAASGTIEKNCKSDFDVNLMNSRHGQENGLVISIGEERIYRKWQLLDLRVSKKKTNRGNNVDRY